MINEGFVSQNLFIKYKKELIPNYHNLDGQVQK
jgi:hypothetical protein